MSSVTYRNQPGIQASHGNVPLAGTSHIYTVAKRLWPENVEQFIGGLLIGHSLHVCSGKSTLGDVRFDMDPANEPHVLGDAARLPDYFAIDSFDTVLCDPPYNGIFQWNHDLLAGLAHVARRRIIFQHWFIPAKSDGSYKKATEKFGLTSTYVWQPRTYFGRAQIVSVFDRKVALSRDVGR